MWLYIKCDMELRIPSSGLFLQPEHNIYCSGGIVHMQDVLAVDDRENSFELGVHVMCGEESANGALIEDRTGRHLPGGENGGAEIIAHVLDGECSHPIDRAWICGNCIADGALRAIETCSGLNVGVDVAVIV